MSKYNINITPDDGFFVVNEEKHTVVWVLENTTCAFINFIRSNSHISPFCDEGYNEENGRTGYGSNLFEKLFMPDKFVGVAKCNVEDGDEWDEETGRLIAFTRGKDAFWRSFFKRADTYLLTIDEWADEACNAVNSLYDKVELNAEKRHDRIKNVLGDYLDSAPQVSD